VQLLFNAFFVAYLKADNKFFTYVVKSCEPAKTTLASNELVTNQTRPRWRHRNIN